MKSSSPRHMGIEVLGLSLVTNFAAGVTTAKIHHEEVMEIGPPRRGPLHLARQSHPHQALTRMTRPPLILGIAGCSGSGKTHARRRAGPRTLRPRCCR